MFCKEAYKKHWKIDIFSKSLQNGTQGGSQREGGEGGPTNQVFRVCFSNGAQDGPKSAPRVPKTPKTLYFQWFWEGFLHEFSMFESNIWDQEFPSHFKDQRLLWAKGPIRQDPKKAIIPSYFLVFWQRGSAGRVRSRTKCKQQVKQWTSMKNSGNATWAQARWRGCRRQLDMYIHIYIYIYV